MDRATNRRRDGAGSVSAIGQQRLDLSQIGPSHRPAIDRAAGRFAFGQGRKHRQFHGLIASAETEHWRVNLSAIAHPHPAFGGLNRDLALHEEQQKLLGRIGKQVETDIGMKADGSGQRGTDQAGPEVGQKAHGFQRRFPQAAQLLRLAVGMEQPLMIEQGLFDFGVIRHGCFVSDGQPERGLAFGAAEILDAFFSDDSGAFLGQQGPEAVVLAVVTGHERTPARRWRRMGGG